MTLPNGILRPLDIVSTSNDEPDLLYDGVGVLHTGELCITTDDPVFFPNGIPTNAIGQVCITSSPTLPVYFSSGMKFDATGRLVVTETAGSPSFSNVGFLFDANGNLLVSGIVPSVAWLTITGTPTENQTLTAALGGGAPTVTSYQWLRGYTPISGATSSTYTLTDADVGRVLRVVANGDQYSAPSAAIAGVNDTPTGSVTISGTPTQGQTLTAVTTTIADPDGLGPFSYQWRRAGAPISGATAATYTLVQADVGAVISVVVSWTDGQGFAESLTSTDTSAVQPVLGAEASALTSRMSIAPSPSRQAAINALIESLKTSGVWAKLDVLQVYAAHDSQAALLNWKSASYTASLSAAPPTFTADRGITPNGSTTHIKTGFNPSTGTQNAQDDVAAFVWQNTSETGLNGAVLAANANGTTAGVQLNALATATSAISPSIVLNHGFGNSWSAGNVASEWGSHGLLAFVRDGAQSLKIFANGAQIASASNAAYLSTGRLNRELYIGGMNWDSAGTVFYASPMPVGLFGYGKSLTTSEHASFSEAITQYMRAVGNGVTPMVGWGDSLSNATYYMAMGKRGVTVGGAWRRSVSQGISAQNSTQIAARIVADTVYTDADWVHVIWMGRNDIANGAQTVASVTIKAKIAESVAAINARSGKYIVLGLTPANLNAPGGSTFTNSEATGSTIGAAIAAHNADLATLYGARFLDIRQALIDYTTANLSGANLTDAAAGLPGRDLYTNDGTGVHFGSTPLSVGHSAVGGAIEDKLQALGW